MALSFIWYAGLGEKIAWARPKRPISTFGKASDRFSPMQFNWPSPPIAFSPCRRTTIVSLLASGLLLADDEAGLPEFLQPVPAKQSASDKDAAQKTPRTLEKLEIVDMGGTSFATRLKVLRSLLQTPPLQI
jgi:hypothetical protein